VIDNLDYPVVLHTLASILRKPVKIIKVHHGTPNFLDSYTGIQGIMARAYGLLLKPACSLSCRCTDLDIAVSSKVRDELISCYGIAPEKVVVLPNTVDPSVFQPRDPASSRKLLGLPLERKLILFIGGDVERKGLSDALAVVKKLRRTHPDAMLVVLTPKLPKNPPDYMIHMPFISSKQITFLYNASNLYILPSRYESGIPLSVLEALASGIPCVVSSQAAELESEGGGLYVADSPDGMLAPCLKLFSDNGLWHRASSAGRSVVLAFFDSRRKKDEYAKAILRFVTSDNRRRG
jgi:glycosyltransferase involved in cell wall biosynthesis